MINPVGSKELTPLFVYDSDERDRLSHEAENLPSIMISSGTAGNAVMMGAGYFTPLTGFMSLADGISCAENMQTTRSRARNALPCATRMSRVTRSSPSRMSRPSRKSPMTK